TWARERGTLMLEEAVWRLTGQPAAVFGLRDRGRLAVGFAADVAIFDAAAVGCGPLRRVWDFPAGADRPGSHAPRLRPPGVAAARGIRAVVVNGVPIRIEGRDTVDPEGPLPGRLLRGGTRR